MVKQCNHPKNPKGCHDYSKSITNCYRTPTGWHIDVCNNAPLGLGLCSLIYDFLIFMAKQCNHPPNPKGCHDYNKSITNCYRTPTGWHIDVCNNAPLGLCLCSLIYDFFIFMAKQCNHPPNPKGCHDYNKSITNCYRTPTGWHIDVCNNAPLGLGLCSLIYDFLIFMAKQCNHPPNPKGCHDYNKSITNCYRTPTGWHIDVCNNAPLGLCLCSLIYDFFIFMAKQCNHPPNPKGCHDYNKSITNCYRTPTWWHIDMHNGSMAHGFNRGCRYIIFKKWIYPFPFQIECCKTNFNGVFCSPKGM
jgi:hypothetical protein